MINSVTNTVITCDYCGDFENVPGTKLRGITYKNTLLEIEQAAIEYAKYLRKDGKLICPRCEECWPYGV